MFQKVAASMTLSSIRVIAPISVQTSEKSAILGSAKKRVG